MPLISSPSFFDNVDFAGTNVINVRNTPGFNASTGVYTLNSSNYQGTLSEGGYTDLYTVLFDSTYSVTTYPNLVEWYYSQDGGASFGALPAGGLIVGYGTDSVLVQVANNFTDLGGGAWVDTGLGNYFVFSSNDISTAANPGFPGTFALTFQGTATAVPEPSTYALLAVALVAVAVVKLFTPGRFFGFAA